MQAVFWHSHDFFVVVAWLLSHLLPLLHISVALSSNGTASYSSPILLPLQDVQVSLVTARKSWKNNLFLF